MAMPRWQVDRSIYQQFGGKLKIVGIRRPFFRTPGCSDAPCPDDDPCNVDDYPPSADPVLNQPVAMALSDMAMPPANLFAVVDADLAGVTPELYGKFHDLLTVRVLKLVLDRWTHSNQTAGTNNIQALGDLYKAIQADVAAKEAENARRYGIGSEEAAADNRLVRGRFRLGSGGGRC